MTYFFNKEKALNHILAIAHKRGISQSELIKDIYDYSHFNRMCNNKEKIKLEILFACCSKLDISFDSLIKESLCITKQSLKEYYDQFELIRTNRNYNDLHILRQTIEDNKDNINTNDYYQITYHIKGIIEAKLNNNFELALIYFKKAFEASNNKLDINHMYMLSKELIEIVIDYTLTLVFLNKEEWKTYTTFLTNPNNKYTDEETLKIILPKISYNTSLTYYRNKSYFKSLNIIESSLEFCNRTKSYIFLGHLYYNKALCLAELNKIEDAKKTLTIAINIFKAQNIYDNLKKSIDNDMENIFNKIGAKS